MSLVEFLLARIAEDESYARDNPAPDDGPVCEDCKDAATYGGFDPGRVLAECEAKRRVVALASWSGQKDSVRDRIFGPAADEAFRHGIKAAMRALALPYAGHPDFQQDWKL